MVDIPSGIIVLWHGAIVDIPAGWVWCDGNNGTPNLKNRFIVQAGGVYAVDQTGGSITHDHTFTSALHNHDIVAGTDIADGSGHRNTSTNETVNGTTQLASSLPPYYALAYIMKT